MDENLILTRESVPSDIERYFRGVLALDQQDKVFSVNLDDVCSWFTQKEVRR